jgi:hypothetical protein
MRATGTSAPSTSRSRQLLTAGPERVSYEVVVLLRLGRRLLLIGVGPDVVDACRLLLVNQPGGAWDLVRPLDVADRLDRATRWVVLRLGRNVVVAIDAVGRDVSVEFDVADRVGPAEVVAVLRQRVSDQGDVGLGGFVAI